MTYTSTHTGKEIDDGVSKTSRIENGTYYLSSPSSTGDWRIRQEFGKLKFERLNATNGAWEEKGYFENSIHSDKGFFTNMILPKSPPGSAQMAPAGSLMFHMELENGEPRPYFVDEAGKKYRMIAAYPDGTLRTYNQNTNTYLDIATEAYVNSKIVDQVQSDWNESNTASKAYIKNKPDIPTPPPEVHLVSATANSNKTATFTMNNGQEVLFDANLWFKNIPPHPGADDDVYVAFVSSKPPTNEEMLAGKKYMGVEELHGLYLAIARQDDTPKYVAFWKPDTLPDVQYFMVKGLHDVWASYPLYVNGVSGTAYVSDNITHATVFKCTVGLR